MEEKYILNKIFHYPVRREYLSCRCNILSFQPLAFFKSHSKAVTVRFVVVLMKPTDDIIAAKLWILFSLDRATETGG